MNFSSFRFFVEKNIIDASAGIFEAFICGDNTGLFEFQMNQVCITYRNAEWTYSFRGCIGYGETLVDAIADEEKNYNAAWLAQIA
jgi:hypothetical protein